MNTHALKQHLKQHWKKYALVAGAAATAYTVDKGATAMIKLNHKLDHPTEPTSPKPTSPNSKPKPQTKQGFIQSRFGNGQVGKAGEQVGVYAKQFGSWMTKTKVKDVL